MQQIEHISVVMICKNAAATIAGSLNSLTAFKEVVIYDNGSTDDTLAIIANYDNVKLVRGDFMGFGKTKAYAVTLASNDWVFSLDADESISKELLNFLEHNWHDKDELTVGKVIRHNYLMGAWVKHGGWGDDWLVRLFNRKQHQFNDAPVHEQVQLQQKTRVLPINLPIVHNAVQNIGQFLHKINTYSEIRSNQQQQPKSLFLIVLRSLFAFIKSYVIKRGFLAGWRGVLIAWNQANGVFYKYMKAYVKWRK